MCNSAIVVEDSTGKGYNVIQSEFNITKATFIFKHEAFVEYAEEVAAKEATNVNNWLNGASSPEPKEITNRLCIDKKH